MPEREKITSKERRTWACAIISNGRRGANRKELMVGYIGPRKDNQCKVALCNGDLIGEMPVADLRGRAFGILFFAYLNGSGIEVAEPTEDERGRRYER